MSGGNVAGSVFNNNASGTFTKGGTGTTQFTTYNTGVAFNNAGTVNVSQGTLQWSCGGTGSAAINVSDGAAVTINSGNYTLAAGASLNGPGTVNFSATETIADRVPVSAVLNISYGTLNGAGGLTATRTVNWTGGTIATGGATVIAADATLSISGSSWNYLQGTLENNGTVNWTGGAIQLSGGTINNNGTWTANSSWTLQMLGGSVTGNAFNNTATGTFTKLGAGTTQFATYSSGVAFNNAGTVSVSQGTLQWSCGGTDSAAINVSDGAAVTVNGGSYTFAAGASLNGPGTVSFSATETFADRVPVSAVLNISYGTLNGAGGLTATRTVNWTGGTIATDGATVIAADATLNISGSSWNYLQAVLQNNGTANWTGGYIQLSGGTINNNGSWTANSSSTLQMSGGSVGGNAFNNNATATFTKQGTGTTQFITSVTGVTFSNAGTVDARSGTVDLGPSLSNYNTGSGTLTGGMYAASGSGTIRFANADIRTLAAHVVLDGPSSRIVDSANHDALTSLATILPSGGLSLQNGRSFTTSALANQGAVVIGSGSSLATTATNEGGQYASTVIDFSSEYTSSSWSAAQALGAPDVPGYGDDYRAWAALDPDNLDPNSNGIEYLTLGFATPQSSNGVKIRESYNSGFVKQIDAVDTDGMYHTVWTGTDASEPGSLVDFVATWSPTSYLTAGVKIYVDSLHVPGDWEEIDAVQLLGTAPPATYVQTAGTTTLAGGTLDADVEIQGGALAGVGAVTRSLTNAAQVTVGDPLGQLAVGDFTQTATGALNVEVGGTAPGSGYSQLVVSGTGVLNGALNATISSGFTPVVGDSFQVLTAPTVINTFSAFTAPTLAGQQSLQVNYHPTDVTLTGVLIGIQVSPTQGLTTTAAGGTASFSVVLNSEPTANVVLPLTSSNPAQGTVSPPSLTFTQQDWGDPQWVTVTGADDFLILGDVPYSIVTGPAVSDDPTYSGFKPSDVSVTNLETDTLDLQVADISVTPADLISGRDVTVYWNDTNTGNSPASGDWTDTVVIKNLTTNLTLATLQVPHAAGDGPLPAGGALARQTTFTLPAGIPGAGQLQFTVTVDADSQVTERNDADTGEDNNSTVFEAPAAVGAPDLVISDLTLSPATGLQSGAVLTIQWTDYNNGNSPASGPWYDTVTVRNATSGETLLTRTTLVSGALAARANSALHEVSFTLPAGNRGVGTITVAVQADVYSQVWEFNPSGTAETNNTSTSSVVSTLTPYPDLIVTDVTLSPSSGLQSGGTLTVEWSDLNSGNAAAANSAWYDQVVLRNPTTHEVLGSTTLYVAGGLAAGASSVLHRASVKLPDGPRGAGTIEVDVVVDCYNQVAEFNAGGTGETNNTWADSVVSTLALYPDLEVTNLSLSPDSGLQSGSPVLVQWNDHNNGDRAVGGAFYDAIQVKNETTGKVLLTDSLYRDPNAAGAGDIGAGGSLARQYAFTLPPGPDGAGQIKVTVTTDAYSHIFENNAAGTAENNNTAVAAALSSLPPYPDLQVLNLALTPATGLQSGDALTVAWDDVNSGTAEVASPFYDRVIVENLTTGLTAATQDLVYDPAVSGALAVGASRARQVVVTLPRGTPGAGELRVTVTTDYYNQVFELNTAGAGGSSTAETNNAANATTTAALEPYADLAVSAVTAPALTIGDPAQVTVNWTVRNIGTGPTTVAGWVDTVIASPDTNPAHGTTLATFPHAAPLGVNDSYPQSQTFSLPPGFTGNYHLFVVTDATSVVFENGSEANNAAEPPNRFAVSPQPYADLVVSSVDVPDEGASGQPLTVSWTITNQGVGVTSTSQWSDAVRLASDPAGTQIVAFLGSFVHDGVLGVNGSYTHTVDVTLPNGLSGTYYVVVDTWGPYQFIYTNNDTGVSGPVAVTLTPPPDLTPTQITGPVTANAGDSVDVSWTVKNIGTGGAAGAWADYLQLKEVGGPRSYGLGWFTFSSPLQANTSYTRTEHVRLPANVQGVFQYVVTTNSSGALFENGATANNKLFSDPDVLTLALPANPDLQVLSVSAPAEAQAGGTVSLTFTVVNQGTVPANGQWTDAVYLSLDTTIGSGDLLLGSYGNQTALAPSPGAGSTYQTAASNLLIPKRYSGPAYLIVKANSSGAINEYPNGDNNLFVHAITINPLPPADLLTSAVAAPDQALDGATVSVQYTVSNLGLGPTDVANWTDTIWLCTDIKRPNPSRGDVLLATLPHSGLLGNDPSVLDPPQSYTVNTTVTLPTHITGQYFITPWADSLDNVLKSTQSGNVNTDDPFELNNDNYKARPITILLTPPPDLVVSAIAPQPTGVGGDSFTVQWTVTNQGGIETEDDTLFDKVYISDNATLNAAGARQWLLGTVEHEGAVAAGDSYTVEQTFTLSPEVSGKYVIVATNTGNIVERDWDYEYLPPTYEGPYTTNNTTVVSALVNRLPPADLQVTSITGQTPAYCGYPVTVTWTVTNFGHAVWAGTRYWKDDVYLSRYPTLDTDRDVRLGYATHSNETPLGALESYTATATFRLPDGIGGTEANPQTFYLFVVTSPMGATSTNLGHNDMSLDLFAQAAYEDPSNNQASIPQPVIYREPDLQVSNVIVPATPSYSGTTIPVTWTVTNIGTRDTRESAWFDRVYLSRSPSLDSTSMMLKESKHLSPLAQGASYDTTVAVRLPDGIHGDYYLLVFTDSNLVGQIGSPNIGLEQYIDYAQSRVAEYQGEGNNIAAVPLPILLANPPDLQVTAVTTQGPDGSPSGHAFAGQSCTVTYAVTNTGAGNTPDTQLTWYDQVYLSRDQFLNGADVYLGSVQHRDGLPAGTAYTNSISFQTPANLTGPWYVFVITDPPNPGQPSGTVFETNESNNATATAVPLLIDQPPPADLETTTITIPATAQVGDQIEIKWTGKNNAGAYAASGTWTDAAYLSSDAAWNVSDPFLGKVSISRTLQPGDTYNAVLNATLPPVAPGSYRVIIRTDVFNNVYETNKVNNTTASADTTGVTVPTLQLDVSLNTTLNTGQDRLYQINIGVGQTLRVDLTSAAADASHELYLRYGAVPTTSAYDAIYHGPLQANQYAVIPSTQAGTYYVLVHGQSEPSADTAVTLLAHVLPFQIIDVDRDRAGDSRYVTTTITGAQFDPQAIVKLIRPGIAEYEPASYQVVNSAQIVAIFDLRDAPHGLYDVAVINPSGETAFAPYRYLVEQALPADVSLGLGGPRVLFAGDQGTYGFSVTNTANVDLPYVQFQYGVPQMDEPTKAYPRLQMTTNLAGQPQVDDVPWAALSPVVNTDGENLAPGYAADLANGASTGLTFTVQTYPNGLPPEADEVPPSVTAFTFHILASATALTPDEFVALQTQQAEQLRQEILQDPAAPPSLQVLAADATNWSALYLTALTQAGLLRPVDTPPAVRDNPLVTSLMATLASGLLAGPAGQPIITGGNLVQFFEQVRTWYGNDPTKTVVLEAGIDQVSRGSGGPYDIAKLPAAGDYNLNQTARTHFQAFNVYVWYQNDWNQDHFIEACHPENPNPTTPQAANFSPFFSLVGSQGQATMIGPLGYGSQQFLPVGQPLPYTIQFTNPAGVATAVGSVQVVQQLDPNLDLRSFRLGDLQLGDIQVHLPSTRGAFQGEFDFTQTKGFILRVSAGIDLNTGTLSYLLQAIDPATGQVVQDPTKGLLQANSAQGAGQGFITYTIMPRAGLATGTSISAQARVLFNTAAPQDTPTITQTIDGVAPATTLTVSPVFPGSSDYAVSWNAVDDASGSGVKGVTVYVAEDGRDFEIWLNQTTDTQAIYNGQAGHTYQFLALATDNAGNREQPLLGQSLPADDSHVNLGGPPAAEATTTDLGPPAQPSPQPSTNPLFVEAELGIPAPAPATAPSEFQTVLQPFSGQAFATGIGQSEAGIGPMAILPLPGGSVLVSGGAGRNELFSFPATGGQAGTPLATLAHPVYDLALDAAGNVWAATGGGPLLELNPTTGAIVAAYGDSLTQSLAIEPGSGLIYVSSGHGIEVFDPVTETFSHYSDLRVGSLAVAPDGALWASAWPHDANVVVRFHGAKTDPEVMFELATNVNSLAFGAVGSALDGLLFVSHDQAADGSTGTDLTMVDLATLRHIAVAGGGTRGDKLATTADGRVLLSQTQQVDVLNPIRPPHVAWTNPVPQAVVALPLGSVSVTFDTDMLADDAGNAHSVLNPANYTLTGGRQGPIAVRGVTYNAAGRTAVLTFDAPGADDYVLTIGNAIRSLQGVPLDQAYTTGFRTVTDLSASVAVRFFNGRADAADQTYRYDVTLTNNTGYDVLAPVVLTLDSLKPGPARLLGSLGPQTAGAWWIDASSLLPDGRFLSGQTTAPLTVTFHNPSGARLSFHSGVLAVPTLNVAPVIDSTPVTTATVGQDYQYQVVAHDVNNSALSYLLYSGPAGMTIDAHTGLVTWTPTIASPAQAAVVLEVFNSRGADAQQQFTVAVAGVNGAPVFDPLEATIHGQEGQPLWITVNATDPQNERLVYWADNLPAGAVFDPAEQTLTWTPGANQAGTYLDVRFVVSDGVSQVTESTTLLIAAANQPPTLARPVDRTVLEGESVHIRLQASDPEGDPLTFSCDFLPGWSTLDPNTGVFDWTPGFDQHGVWEVPFTVSDGTNAVTQTITVTVLNVNAPPQFENLGAWRVAEGQDVQFRAFAEDPNNPAYLPPDRASDGSLTPLLGSDPTVTYSVSGLPAGATFDLDTAMFFWEIGYDAVGTYQVSFTATNDGDGTGVPKTSTVAVPITVLNVNRVPTVAPIDNQTMDHDATLPLPIEATDPDGDPLTLTVSGLPGFGTFADHGDGTGQFTFTPGADDRGNYTIWVTATDNGDGNGRYAVLSHCQSFVLTVNNPNLPPHLLPIGNKVAIIGQPLAFTLQAEDDDQDALSWSAFGLPAGASLTPSSVYGQAAVAWTPTAADVGTYTVSFQVADDGNAGAGAVLADRRTMHLVVRATNAAPVLLPISNPTIAAGQLLTLPVQAIDPDGDALTYIAGQRPLGASLDPTTGVLSWRPGLFQAGTYSGIELTASDGNLTASTTISITVTPVNQPPIMVPLAPQSAREGTALQFTLAANDLNGEMLTYAAVSGMPSGAQFNPATGKFLWIPTFDQAGDYTVGFGVTDLAGLGDSIVVQIYVDNVDRAPTLAVSNHATILGQTLAFALVASDPDQGTTLSYSAAGMPEGAALNSSTGQFMWTPGPTQAGDYAVSFAVSDGELVTTQVALLRATINPVAPQVLVELTPSFPAIPGQPVLVHAIASSLAPITGLSLRIAGQTVALDAQGRATYVPQTPGRIAITATATDADGMVGTFDTVLKVRDPNNQAAPVVTLDQRLGVVKLTSLTSVNGSVISSNLDSWVLDVAPLGTSAYTKLASGNTPLSGALGTFDPAAVENGFYQLRLTATDISGRVSQTAIVVEANTATKPFQYLRTETDLTVELDGATFHLIRQYDSLNTRQSGRLGYGWGLAGLDTRIQTSVLPTGQEAQGVYNPFLLGTRVYLTLPDGSRVGFTFTPIAHAQTGLTYFTPAFTSDAGVPYTLTSASGVLTLAGDRFYDLKTGTPYNPASGLFDGPDYTLSGPDGTVYAIAATRGVAALTPPGGPTWQVTDSGVIAPNGERLSFIHDAAGRLTSVTAPDGTQVLYRYDDAGNLVSARNLTLGQSCRYGYSASQPHLLELAVSRTAGQSEVIQYTPNPVILPLTADLGGSGQFLLNTASGVLTPGGTDRYAFGFRSSEITATTAGTVFLGVQVEAAAGSSFQPAVPVVAGLTPLATEITLATEISAASAFALFDITREGLERLDVSGANAASGGAYTLRLFVAGDANGDGTVDGNDGLLLMVALGSAAKQADANLDGLVDAEDMQLLASNLGFTPNGPPVLAAGTAMTHVDVPVMVDLMPLAADPEGDAVYFRVVAAQNGTAALATDGHTVIFTPAAGYGGPASFQFQADDGYGTSLPATVSINVSGAPLVNLDFRSRLPRLSLPSDAMTLPVGGDDVGEEEFQIQVPLRNNLGMAKQLVAVGDFTDQQGVVLPASYVTWQSTNPAVMNVTANGTVTAVADGTTVILISARGLQAATAGTVGYPTDPVQQQLYGNGFETSIQAESLAAHIGYHQLDVHLGDTDLSPGSAGTLYFVSDSNVIQVDANGMVTAGSAGIATITVINGPAEAIVPVNVVTPPAAGPVAVGADGGVIQGADGSLVMVAPGSVAADTLMSIAPMTEANLPASLPDFVQFAGAFNLDLGGTTLDNPVQLVVPAPAGADVGTPVYFYRYGSLPDANGNPFPVWLESEVGRVEADGYVHTTSENNVYTSGTYGYGMEPTGVSVRGQATFANGAPFYEATFAIFATLTGNTTAVGALFNARSSHFEMHFPPVVFDVTMAAIPAQGLPTLTPFTLDLTSGASSYTFNPLINTPASDNSPPILQSLSLDLSTPRYPVLTINGQNFGSHTSTDTLQVVFRVGNPDGKDSNGNAVVNGGRDIVIPNSAINYVSPTQISAVVPNTFTLGTASISVIRTFITPQATSTAHTGGVVIVPKTGGIIIKPKAPKAVVTTLQSAFARFPVTGLYGFSTEPGKHAVAVFDNRVQIPDPNDPSDLIVNPNLNRVIAQIPLAGELTPEYLAVTNDHSRVYVTTKEGSIAILDAVTFQQIGTDNQDVRQVITPPGNPHPTQIVIDDAGQYAYVTDSVSPTIYVLDINPYSAKYNTVTKTLSVADAPYGLYGLDINSDNTRLFVAAPNRPAITFLTGAPPTETSNILDIDLTLDPASGLPKWQQLRSIPADQGAYGVARTSDPNVMLFTDYLSDRTGLGVIHSAKTNPSVTYGTLHFPNYNPVTSTFAVHNASAVAVTPDGKYAFVTGFNQPNQNLPSSDHGEPNYEPAGSTLGIFQFQAPNFQSPLLVAATRAIPLGFPLDLTISPDGTYLYANFKNVPTTAGQGALFIYNIPAIRTSVEALQQGQGSKQPYLLTRNGIDDIVDGQYVGPKGNQQPKVAIDTQAAYAVVSPATGVYVFQVYDPAHAPLALGGGAQGVAAEGYPLSVVDASGDDSPQTVFYDGALSISYDFSGASGTVTNVAVQLLQDGRVVGTLKSFTTPSLANYLLNLDPSSARLRKGSYFVRADATIAPASGATRTISSALQPLAVLAVNTYTGGFSPQTFTLNPVRNQGTVYYGGGGTNILDLSRLSDNSPIVSIDGQSLSTFQTGANSIISQAIYHGTAFDYIRLADGEEIYFQGIEGIQLSSAAITSAPAAAVTGQVLWLIPQPTDPLYSEQWNLAVTDVPDAWRFTTGSGNVLLVSLDTGLQAQPGTTNLDELTGTRVYTTPGAVNGGKSDHGNMSVGIMAATSDNYGIAGINWVSPVRVYNAHNFSQLAAYMTDAIDVANTNGQHVVFQCGVGGEDFLGYSTINVTVIESDGTVSTSPTLVHGNTATEEMVKNAAQAGLDNSVWAVAAGNETLDPDAIGAITLWVIITWDAQGNQEYSFVKIDQTIDSMGNVTAETDTVFPKIAANSKGPWPPGVVARTDASGNVQLGSGGLPLFFYSPTNSGGAGVVGATMYLSGGQVNGHAYIDANNNVVWTLPVTGGLNRMLDDNDNFMNVGALEDGFYNGTWLGNGGVYVDGPAGGQLANAASVNKASYSDFGPSLTLMAPTNSPTIKGLPAAVNQGGGL
jgi:YD repeat-containing protein